MTPEEVRRRIKRALARYSAKSGIAVDEVLSVKKEALSTGTSGSASRKKSPRKKQEQLRLL